MNQAEKYETALRLLKELNCPEPIMEALWIFGLTIHDDEVKLHNWEALADGNTVEGEGREL